MIWHICLAIWKIRHTFWKKATFSRSSAATMIFCVGFREFYIIELFLFLQITHINIFFWGFCLTDRYVKNWCFFPLKCFGSPFFYWEIVHHKIGSHVKRLAQKSPFIFLSFIALHYGLKFCLNNNFCYFRSCIYETMAPSSGVLELISQITRELKTI